MYFKYNVNLINLEFKLGCVFLTYLNKLCIMIYGIRQTFLDVLFCKKKKEEVYLAMRKCLRNKYKKRGDTMDEQKEEQVVPSLKSKKIKTSSLISSVLCPLFIKN